MKKSIVAAGALFLSSTVGAAPLFAQDMSAGKAGASTTADAVWPACRPGPGDDRCIQAYEPGVKQAYDQWAMSASDTGMGGPFEPVTDKDMSVTGSTDAMWTGGKDGSLAPMQVAMSDNPKDMAKTVMAKAPAMEHPDMTAEAMQTNSAWGKFGGMGK